MKLKKHRIYPSIRSKYLSIVAVIILLSGLIVIFSNPLLAEAATDNVNPAQQKIFDDQICAPLKYPSGCKDYNNQADLNAAEKKICAANPSVKSGCDAYSQAATTGGYTPPSNDTCGGPSDSPVQLSINIGCKGEGNPIADATFAIIRVLSDGVGLVVVGSIVVGGIQYTASQGDPQATAKAVGRLRSSVLALILFIFGYAILNYLIPAGVL